LVLFGGYAAAGQPAGPYFVLNETWEWKFKTGWSLFHPATVPRARGSTAMIYDEARHVVLMYGGRDTSGGDSCGGGLLCSSDTWTWNGADWTELHPQTHPPSFMPKVSNDAPNTRVLLYAINGNVPETWNWDGASWTLKVSGSSNPQPNRAEPVMTYDPVTRHTIMFGGFTQGGGNVNPMWTWSGERWTSLGAEAPFRILSASAAADIDRRVLVGYQSPQAVPPVPPGDKVIPSETWAWDGVRWTKLRPRHQPNVWASGLFADPKGHQVLLVGMNYTNGKAIEIWAWDGDDWGRLG
jgi:hypothetical protein